VTPDPSVAPVEPERPAGRGAGTRRYRFRRPAATTIAVATVLLFLMSWIVQPQSVSHSSIFGMLPFAAILAIAAAGQTLVIQQGGIDLSVPGMMSIAVVVLTHYPDGQDGKVLPAVLIAIGIAVAAGLVTGVLVSRVGITAIVTTLGVNALLYGCNIQMGQGSSRTTTQALHDFATGTVIGIPTSVIVAVVIVAIVALIDKRTVVGRRFEAVGANAAAARAAGVEPSRYQIGAYVGATILYCIAGILLAGVVTTPSAFQGNSYLLPSVAAVVLGGTSLLGGVGSVVATGVAALFLSQLDQLILTTGLSGSVTYLVQAGALAAGILVYGVRVGGIRAWFDRLAGTGGAGATPGGTTNHASTRTTPTPSETR
jgi:ribose transport system permease protein